MAVPSTLCPPARPARLIQDRRLNAEHAETVLRISPYSREETTVRSESLKFPAPDEP
jgi:hypothetical protein